MSSTSKDLIRLFLPWAELAERLSKTLSRDKAIMRSGWPEAEYMGSNNNEYFRLKVLI
jgi:hypothetical protein